MPTQRQHAFASVNVTPPAFIHQIMEDIRAALTSDSLIRVRMDSSAKTVVSFTAQWVSDRNRDIARRVFVERKLTDAGGYSVTFMAKMFDENAVNVEYRPEALPGIGKKIMKYLLTGELVKVPPA